MVSKKSDILDKIWMMLAEDMKDRLENGETVVTDAGEVVKVSLKPATLSVIAKFLKDNENERNIPDSPVHTLADLLAKAEGDMDRDAQA
jgi:hypothetical protein